MRKQTHVKVENGQVVNTMIPRKGFLPDGRAVSNFHLLPDDELRKAGWMRVEEEKVREPDGVTEELGPVEYEVQKDKVIKRQTLLPRSNGPEEIYQNLEDRINELEQRIEALEGSKEPEEEVRK